MDIALKRIWSRIEMALRGVAEVAKSEPKHLAPIRSPVSKALHILEEDPSVESVEELEYALTRIDEFIAKWRPSPTPSPGVFYVQPNWASSTDRDNQEALRQLADVRRKLEATKDEASSSANVLADPVSDLRVSGTKPAHTESTMKVFVSHSSMDRNVAAALVDLLRAALLLPARDIRCTSVDGYKLNPGADADDQLRQEVFQSECFIALLSPSSLRSIYVMFEMGARWGAQRPVLPIMIAGVDPGLLKPPLSGIHAISGTSESDLHQMISTIANALALHPEQPSVYLKPLKTLLALTERSSPAGRIVDEATDTRSQPELTRPDKVGTYLTAYEAVHYLADESQWGAQKEAASALLNAPIEFKERAAEGRIRVYGASSQTGQHELIPKTHWMSYGLDLATIYDSSAEGKTATASLHANTYGARTGKHIYSDLKIVASDVYHVWPPGDHAQYDAAFEWAALTREEAIRILWKLRRDGVGIRNEPVPSEQLFPLWKTKYENWRNAVLLAAEKVDENLRPRLEVLDRLRPPPALPVINADHASCLAVASEILLRLEEKLP